MGFRAAIGPPGCDSNRPGGRIPVAQAGNVLYSFRMADHRISTTACFARFHASARISCGRCGHSLVATGADLARMFPTPMLLEAARYRFRCRACGGRAPEIDILRKPPRD